ncbi:MAG: CRTAC1 family protein [Pseudomonadota bacterium]|nr:CRTAC1 family protein [Pseudomonadota bacterium]
MVRIVPLLLLVACAAPDGESRVQDETAGPEPVETGLVLGEPSVCAAPLAGPTWTEVGGDRGLLRSPNPSDAHGAGGTVVADDLDADGDVDLVVAYDTGTYLYLREGAAYRVASYPGPDGYFLLALADVDADGRRDVLLGGNPMQELEYTDGELRPRPIIPTELGAGLPPAQGFFPGDLDADGALDLFVIVSPVELPDYMLHGRGDGWFEPVLDAVPAGMPNGMGFDARWFDWDRDLDLDLYVVNDQGPTYGANVLFENDGGTLVDASDRCACDLSVSGMGVDLGDYDRDGIADLYVTQAAGEALLRGLPDGTYVDTTRATGIPQMSAFEMGWGAIFLDLDNDADLDLVEARGDHWQEATNPEFVYATTPTVYLQANGVFVDSPWFDRDGSWRAVVAWDDNQDGVLDLLVTDVVERPALWLSDGCTEAGWLEVEGPVGAKVEVRAGGVDQTTWITQQSSMAASRTPIAHVGLGTAQEVELIRVTLLTGEVRTLEGPFEARRRVVVAP